MTCRSRYPRLFSTLFWVYLAVEGLCFVADVAVIGSTIASAKHPAAGATSRSLRGSTDDDLFGVPTPIPTPPLTSKSASKIDLEGPPDWKTLQALILQQWKLQWEKSEALLQDMLQHVFRPQQDDQQQEQPFELAPPEVSTELE